MDLAFRDRFQKLWEKYFPSAELPLAFYYRDDPDGAILARGSKKHRCFVCDLQKVRKGESVAFSELAVSCGGGKRYLGFKDILNPDFPYFLSCGIPGKLEGERYKKSPELVREMMKNQTFLPAPAKFIIFKRWDNLTAGDAPVVVIFFAVKDVLSGLFTLVGFDDPAVDAVFAPFGAGCATIVKYPLEQLKSENPKAVLGMFDVSARPCVEPDVLTLSIPMPRFQRMVDNMEESFLITRSWDKVRRRIKKYLTKEIKFKS